MALQMWLFDSARCSKKVEPSKSLWTSMRFLTKQKNKIILNYLSYNHGQKPWDTCVSGPFSNSHRSNPSLHHPTMLEACIQNSFRVSTLYRVGEGRTARKFRKRFTVLRGNREMTEKYECGSTVPRTSVQDCTLGHQDGFEASYIYM